MWILLLILIVVAVLVYTYGLRPSQEETSSSDQSVSTGEPESEEVVGAIPSNYQSEEIPVMSPAPPSSNLE